MHEVVLYTRPGCGLCVHAKEALQTAQRRVEFVLREIDIDTDPKLFEEHRYDIPVIAIDGRRAFKHKVEVEALVARLTR